MDRAPSSSQSITGRCLCGGVAYTVNGPRRDIWYCHCEHCRRVTGHHMAATAAAPEDVTVTSDETLRWYSHQPGVEYGFCRRCGSTLFWRAADQPRHLSICAGTLDPPTGLAVAGVLFAAQRADYVAPHPDAPTWPADRQVGRTHH